ncbi:N-acetyltransferase [Psychroflexus sp. CAK8W]|uniref:N-acetyltransferase n=1 Tax=Psychroflexus longus TaxID=2873596 RepID=A0ABS7XN01_9FLAO|nr:acyltransferase [Psychroflexus longus]MBZ9779431.1 N-acetyltransferase [Psychroflexus longus]
MIHSLAEVQTSNIGNNTTVWQFVVILKEAKIGSNCNINMNVFIENDVQVGDNVTIKPGVQLWDGTRVGNNVFIGPNVTFTNDKLPRSKAYPDQFLKTKINDYASIGANATILPNLNIGSYAMIGAGSVVTKDVKPYQLVVGNPARHIGYITETGQKISLNLEDEHGNKFVYENDRLKKLEE